MAEVSGIIQEIRTKQVAGGKLAYDIVVGGEAYGAGLYAPKAKQGDYVKFELDDSRGFKNVGRNSLKVSRNKPPADVVAAAAATTPSKSTTGGSVDMRQEVISRQSALNSAIAFMQVLAATDSLGLPKTDTKGKRMEVMTTLLDKFQQDFYEANTGIKWKDIAPKAAAKDVVEDEPEEEADASAVDDGEWD